MSIFNWFQMAQDINTRFLYKNLNHVIKKHLFFQNSLLDKTKDSFRIQKKAIFDKTVNFFLKKNAIFIVKSALKRNFDFKIDIFGENDSKIIWISVIFGFQMTIQFKITYFYMKIRCFASKIHFFSIKQTISVKNDNQAGKRAIKNDCNCGNSCHVINEW